MVCLLHADFRTFNSPSHLLLLFILIQKKSNLYTKIHSTCRNDACFIEKVKYRNVLKIMHWFKNRLLSWIYEYIQLFTQARGGFKFIIIFYLERISILVFHGDKSEVQLKYYLIVWNMISHTHTSVFAFLYILLTVNVHQAIHFRSHIASSYEQDPPMCSFMWYRPN